MLELGDSLVFLYVPEKQPSALDKVLNSRDSIILLYQKNYDAQSPTKSNRKKTIL